MKPTLSFASLLLTAFLLTGCGGGFRNGHAPGDIERLENTDVYHLADGVFLHERHEGGNFYYLIEETASDYRLTPDGWEVEFGGKSRGAAILERPPENVVAAIITLIPEDGLEATRFPLDRGTLESVVQEFSEATTVGEIYQRRESSSAHPNP